MLNFEKQYYNEKIKLICGVDEAGRGPLCGPVVASAVILKEDFYCELINDSKKMSEKDREKAYKIILKDALAIGISYISSSEIDKINIYEASRKAMINAIKNLNIKPNLILTDAMPIRSLDIEVIPIIKGDAKCECIAAASIIAKVSRDRYMKAISKKYPEYDLENNKGYGTKKHLEALKKYGPIPNFHRFTYAPIKGEQLKLF